MEDKFLGDEDHHHDRYVTREEFHDAYEDVLQLLQDTNSRINMAQADVDAVTASLTQVSTDLDSVQKDLSASSTKLQSEIDSLKAANPALDLTGLQAAAGPIDNVVKALDTAVQAVGGLVPTPAPAPTPSPAPSPAPAPGP